MNDMEKDAIETALYGSFIEGELDVIREFLVLMDKRGFRELTVGELVDGRIWKIGRD